MPMTKISVLICLSCLAHSVIVSVLGLVGPVRDIVTG